MPKQGGGGRRAPSRELPRGTQNEARWAEILQAAALVFSERGYAAARLQDIAARVGLLTGSLYHYIDSKEDLLFALVDSAHRMGLATTEEDEATRHADAPTRLRAFITRWMALLDEMSEPMAAVEQNRPHLNPEHHAQIDARRRHLHDFVRQIIEQGIAEGTFDPATDVGVATNSLFEVLQGTRTWARRPGKLSYGEIGTWYADLFLRGLARDAGT